MTELKEGALEVRAQGRTGYEPFFILSAGFIVIGLTAFLGESYFGWFRLVWALRLACIALGLIGALGFIAVERMSRPPVNNPAQFLALKKRGDVGASRGRQVLVCLGDSITHGTVSDDWSDRIASDGRIVGEKVEGAPSLEVVNAAQNNICTHTVLKERVYHVQACRPNYVLVLIGSNDMMSIYREDWARDKTAMWNLPETPTMNIFEQNLRDIVQHLLLHTEAKIGLCTLPPMGEDMMTPSNEIIRQANTIVNKIAVQHRRSKRVTLLDAYEKLKEKISEKRAGTNGTIHSVDNFLIAAAVMNLLHHLLGISWNTLSQTITANKVISDSLHLNETGGNVMVDLVVEWLLKNGVHT